MGGDPNIHSFKGSSSFLYSGSQTGWGSGPSGESHRWCDERESALRTVSESYPIWAKVVAQSRGGGGGRESSPNGFLRPTGPRDCFR